MKTVKRVLTVILVLAMVLTFAPSLKTVKADDTVHIKAGPNIGDIYISKTIGTKDIKVHTSGQGVYTLNDDPTEYFLDKTIVKLFKNGTLYATKTISTNSEAVFKSVPVSYGKNDSFKVALYMNILGKEKDGPSRSFKLTSEKIPNTKVKATKISNKKAYLRWNHISGVSGYYIYMGKKMIKTAQANTTKTMISKKKAGKGKFKVCPFVKSGKKVYKNSSNVVKPKKNQHKYKRNLKVKSEGYATCHFAVTKISLKGKTYTVTGYALNHRMFKVERYKQLTIGLKVDGKKAFKKKIKNVKLNIKKNGKKKFTFKIKGKSDKDLAWGNSSLKVSEDADWGIKNDSFKD